MNYRIGYPGILVEQGEIILTKSGRKTTPFPNIDLSSNRKAQNSVKRVDAWLVKNALIEAEKNDNEFLSLLLSQIDLKNLSQSDKDMAEDALFSEI